MRYLDETDYFPENLSILGKFLRDVKEGKNRTISFLGASVTKGEMVHRGTEFFSVLSQRWKDYLGTDTIPRLINASKSGTMSSNALFSMWELLEEKPDAVFLDFSVNDPGQPYLREAFEGIVYHFLKRGCMVIILLFCNQYGHSTKGAMQKIAKYYQLPVVDIGRLVMDNIAEGNFTWDDFASDYVHPNEWGHEWIAENLLRFFDRAEKEAGDKTIQLPEKPCFDGVFRDIKIADKLSFDETYSYACVENCSAVILEFTQVPQKSRCSLDIYLDEQYQKTFCHYHEFSWDNRVCELLLFEEKNATHKIQLLPAKEASVTEEELARMNIKLAFGYEIAN